MVSPAIAITRFIKKSPELGSSCLIFSGVLKTITAIFLPYLEIFVKYNLYQIR
ncbi:hypothetical protein MYAER_3135 [Microcystis aeruginosa NIES-2549]|uniref:Uncharacterized protein n=1 Tax=Microcystis aeruginosa NIES-2549 TaxID=1641812 RepID=A0A0F6RMQ4_MICAE|nr:hypothetical protein MYAER_3135 [Microcystis aeruginosa NIES-2549]AOC53886.1 hypothetical protein amyaer_3181 [Microcystis aeruginosa NIES-2481]